MNFALRKSLDFLWILDKSSIFHILFGFNFCLLVRIFIVLFGSTYVLICIYDCFRSCEFDFALEFGFFLEVQSYIFIWKVNFETVERC